MTSNSSYFRGAPKIKKITISIIPDTNTVGLELRQHGIDSAVVQSSMFEEFRDAPGIARNVEPQNGVVLLALNCDHPLLRDINVRRAFAKAIDRKRLVATISLGGGTAAYADLPFLCIRVSRRPVTPIRT